MAAIRNTALEAGFAMTPSSQHKPGPRPRSVYARALKLLSGSGVEFVVGGGYAFQRYTGIPRHTRDLDVFVRPDDVERVLALFAHAGFKTTLPFPHWLGKVYKGRTYIDVIFNSGNGLTRVDDDWFEHAVADEVLGVPVKLSPVEEMIWSKAFIQERERFDGSDILHLLLECSSHLDWKRMLDRFGENDIVLFGHLSSFVYVYPTEAWRVPDWVWHHLDASLLKSRRRTHTAPKICRGTLYSRTQYIVDLERGFRDARLPPDGDMRHDDVAIWTEAARTQKTGVPEERIVEHVEVLRTGARPRRAPPDDRVHVPKRAAP
jgi:hypothetical protein